MRLLKKILVYTCVVLLLAYLLFINIAPPLVEKGKNKTSLPKPYKISQQAQDLIAQTDFIGDLHCDALLWDRNLTKKKDYGHVDFPRMREGNMALQAFTIVTKSPKGQNFDKNSAEAMDMITPLCIGQGQPPSTWFSLIGRALYQCKKLHKFADKERGDFIIIRTKKDFQNLLNARKRNPKAIGGLLGIEGGHCLEGKIENLQKVYDAGVRMLGPTHFFDNEMGGSAHGEVRGGLSEFGITVIKEMDKKGMIMDIAHSSENVIDDILARYKGPILSSHTGVDGTYPSSRNLSDRHLKAVAARDGLVGIAFFPGAIGDGGLTAIVKAMKYTRDLIGIEYIALGSDFDGSVTVPFDVTGFGLLVDELLKEGFSEKDIQAILGGNLKRFLLKWL